MQRPGLNDDFKAFLANFSRDEDFPLDDPRQTFGVHGGLRSLAITAERLDVLLETLRRQQPLMDDMDYIPTYRRIFYIFRLMQAAEPRFAGDYTRLTLIGECLRQIARIVGEAKS